MDPMDNINNAADALRQVATRAGGFWDDADARIATKEVQVDDYLATASATFDARIPIAQNLIKDPLLREFDDSGGPKIPLHMNALGLTIEAVHPYTKGFEHLSQVNDVGSTGDSELATESLPFWEGVHTSGPRFPRGGLAGGWGEKAVGSHILKITAVPGAANANRILFFTSKLSFQASYLRFRAYIKLSVGSAIGVGSHAGYGGLAHGRVSGRASEVAPEADLIFNGQKMTYRFEKTLLDTGPQGWSLIDVGIAAEISVGFRGRLDIGFNATENIEAYLAMPQVYLPKSSPFQFTE